jgi:hypothetical protein
MKQEFKSTRRSRRVKLALKLVYLAIHKGAQQVDDVDSQVERIALPPAVYRPTDCAEEAILVEMHAVTNAR